MRAAFIIAGKDLRERSPRPQRDHPGDRRPTRAGDHLQPPPADRRRDVQRRVRLRRPRWQRHVGGFLSGPLAAVEDAGIAGVVAVADEDAAKAAIEAGDADAAAVIPARFEAAVQSGARAEVEIIGETNAGLATEILRSLAESYTAELQAIRLAVGTVVAGQPSPPDEAEIGELVERAIATPDPITLTDAETELRRASPETYFPASMAIFFLFFTAQFGPLSLLGERRQGTLPRLVAAPIPPWSIVAGKALGSFVLGVVSLAVIVVASTLLVGAEWGNPVGVAALIVAAVLSAMGITALITTLARTEEQAGGWNAIVAVTLGILGGAFFSLAQAPELLSRLSFLTPHAWFLQGLDELAAPSASLADLALPLAALLTIAVVTGGIGLRRASRLVTAR